MAGDDGGLGWGGIGWAVNCYLLARGFGLVAGVGGGGEAQAEEEGSEDEEARHRSEDVIWKGLIRSKRRRGGEDFNGDR